eukprot:Clim_evm3s161 gene=Clim_evmTU3s161
MGPIVQPPGMTPIYMDYNATAPVSIKAREAISEALEKSWGNPSSKHEYGVAARQALEGARDKILDVLCPDTAHRELYGTDLIFTSGGTECNNWVIYGAIQMAAESGMEDTPNIVTTRIEHDATLNLLEEMRSQGKITVTYVDTEADTGCFSADDMISALRPNTVLVCCMAANNETGVLQPVGRLADRLADLRVASQGRPTTRFPDLKFPWLFVDAAQILGKVDFMAINIDFVSVVGHKFGGPSTGALYMDNPGRTPLPPLFLGGGQEKGLRSGTENVAMAVGLATALEESVVRCREGRMRAIQELRNRMEDELANDSNLACFAHFKNQERLPNTSSLCFPHISSNKLLVERLEGKIICSVGAACHSDTAANASPILTACKVRSEHAERTLRLSLPPSMNIDTLNLALEYLKRAAAEAV